MAVNGLDFAALVSPVSPDDPCGPDLELAGDPDFLQTVGRVEGLLPASFFVRDAEDRPQPFDRTSIDIAAEQKRLAALLGTSRDLRLLTIFARLSALNRDLAGLAGCLDGAATLIRERWDDVHPRGDEGDFQLRAAVLQALDDMPTVILPLQHVPIADSKRHGAINFRSVMIAEGEVPAREGDPAIDRAAIDRALTETDLDRLRGTYDQLALIRSAATAIQAVTAEKAGYEQAASLDRLGSLVGRMLGVLEPIIVARDPAAAETMTPADAETSSPDGHATPAATPPGGRIASFPEAAVALAAAAGYLHRAEPSSPAELLVRQAQSLVGKSFLEVIQALVPAQAEAATIAIGADRAFELSFGQLTAIAEAASSDVDEEAATEDEDSDPPAEPRLFRAASRAQAVDLLRQVAAFYRSAEPSSPIPLLIERATGLVDRDFLTILRDVLPIVVQKQE